MRPVQDPHPVPRCPAAGGGVRGGPCPRPAGFGTTHPGRGLCRQHELAEEGAARARAARPVPPAVFLEPRYVDGLPYHETAQPRPPAAGQDGGDEWEPDDRGFDEAGRVVDLRNGHPKPFRQPPAA